MTQICQATFKEHCQYPKCDCDRPVTAKGIREFLSTEKGQEIADVLDGPEQECYPIEDKVTGMVQRYVTNPVHGGKVTCYKCNGFVAEEDSVPYLDYQHPGEFPKAHFHKDCYNGYEHYYGLDKPID